jgi:hypothetical protein
MRIEFSVTTTESGWPGFFRILRIYLTHFRGQRSAMMQWMAPAAGTEAEAWETLTAALGLKGVSAGQRWTAALGAVNFGGQSMVTLSFYLYGDQAAGAVARETPNWQAWIDERFPMPSETSKSE